MLSHKVLTRQDVGRAASYYEDGADDYYASEGGASEWQGKGAGALGLVGSVDPERFRELLAGRVDGETSRTSTRQDANQRIGIDLTFSAPSYSHLTPDVKREAVRLLDRTEKLGDIQETEGAEKENPRGHRGLDGAGRGI